ncbi:MAG: hypothetical protein F6K19_07145 [Cyanothece sp. SIO1E1]|nr:hypothetical protein [Cyanothece sp. SIO1E1]
MSRIRCRLQLAITTSILALLPSIAIAQVADVPQPNRSGDYTTAFVLGNRGYYTNPKWLVVDPDRNGLNRESFTDLNP